MSEINDRFAQIYVHLREFILSPLLKCQTLNASYLKCMHTVNTVNIKIGRMCNKCSVGEEFPFYGP